MGMSQPPKSTILAPRARWVALNTVCLVIRTHPGGKTAIIAFVPLLFHVKSGLRNSARRRERACSSASWKKRPVFYTPPLLASCPARTNTPFPDVDPFTNAIARRKQTWSNHVRSEGQSGRRASNSKPERSKRVHTWLHHVTSGASTE